MLSLLIINSMIFCCLQYNRYKDLVSVYRHGKSDKITVNSKVFQVNSIEGFGSTLFPSPDSDHNGCYLSIDPRRKIVNYWYSAFIKYW